MILNNRFGFDQNTDFRRTIDVVDRLQVISSLSDSEWLDLLGLTWKDYWMVRSGLRGFSDTTLERLASHFNCKLELLKIGEIDYKSIQIGRHRKSWMMPDRYSVATHGRRRTTITSFDFLERRYGWRLRFDTLRHLGMTEMALMNEFAPVSMRFITDACGYLHGRQFRSSDFFSMGAYSYIGNRETLLGQTLKECSSTGEVLERMWIDLLPLYEQNCTYRFLQLTNSHSRIQVISNAHVAEEMGVAHLGNEHICSLKAGMMASASCYIGQPMSKVRETSCVHRGDSSCIFEIQYENACST